MINSPARRSPLGLFPGQPTPRRYDRVVEILRTRHHSHRAEQAYTHWICRFVLGHKDIKTAMVYARIEPWRSRGPQPPRPAAKGALDRAPGIVRTEASA